MFSYALFNLDMMHIKLKLNTPALEWYHLIIDDRELENISSKEYNNFIFCRNILNLDNSFDIVYKLFKFGVVILDIITEGAVSQTFYLRPSVI